jgi:hypothetical protein
MELKDFITKTISEISIGIRHGNIESQKDNYSFVGDQNINIDFDINVTSEENATTSGGGKITVASVINAGLSKEAKTTTSNYSRIKFNVHMKFNNTVPKSKES